MRKTRKTLQKRVQDTSCWGCVSKKRRIPSHILLYLFLFLGFARFLSSRAHADIVSDVYLAEYFEDLCHNPDLDIPASPNKLASKIRAMEIIDLLNKGATSYATSDTADTVFDVTYLNETLNLLAGDTLCCPDGVYDSVTATCRGTDDTPSVSIECATVSQDTTVSCLAEGQYLNAGTCASCPHGWLCPASTNGALAITYYNQ